MALRALKSALAVAGAATVSLVLAPAAHAAGWRQPLPQHSATARPMVGTGNGSYTGIASTRALDTRNGVGAVKAPVAAGGTLTVQVLGVGAVPATGVSAVVLNLAGLNSVKPGYVIGWASTSSRPHTSILNYFAGTAGTSNEVTVAVGTDGKIALFNGGPAPVQLVADLVGYYADGTPSGGGFGAIDPVRLYDSRTDTAAPYLQPGDGIAGPVTGQLTATDSVPSDATAVLINLAALNATRPGYVYGYASQEPRPHTSVLGYNPGPQAVSNEIVVPVGPDGEVEFDNSPTGAVQLVVDLVGYFTNDTTPVAGGLIPVNPSRALDTRPHPVAKGATLTLPLAGTNGIPATGATDVVVNVTTLTSTAQGYLIAWPSSDPRPHTSVINFAKAQTISNEIVLPLGANGSVNFYNAAAGSVELIVDVVGYYAAPA
ncbi:MAG TPA: hypothetical protein VHO01_11690 [Jatrophihabitans sp.]|nr:hypothetical protein [Jatrophihabitans sp.]